MIIGVNGENRVVKLDGYIIKNEVVLKSYDVNRQQVFKNMSDYFILNYCYVEYEMGYLIYPAMSYSKILLNQKDEEVLNLQAQVIELEFEKRTGVI